ncbi:MAG: radical SAM protein [Thermodesulfobacteriota bacterium]
MNDSIRSLSHALTEARQHVWRLMKFHGTRTSLYGKAYGRLIRSSVEKRHGNPPLSVYIELTNLCNSDCTICPRKIMTRKKGVMSMSLFRRVVDECAGMGVKYAVLQMFGEPFMDKAFLEKARYAKAKGLKTSIYTNGSLLDEGKIRAIVAEGLLDHMVFSIDGVNEEEYGKNRRKLDFATVEANLYALLAERNRARTKTPKVKVHCAHLPRVHYDICSYREKWEPVADGVSFTPARDWGGQLKGVSAIKKPDKRFPCFLLWNQFYVLWDGRATFCSVDFDGRHVVGDVREQSLASLWQGEGINAIRKQHLDNRMNRHPLCGQCVYSTHEKTWWWHDAEELLF